MNNTAFVKNVKSADFTGFLKTIAFLLAIAIILRGTVIEAFKIPSRSMVPTLQVGDHLLVSKLSYGIRLPFVTKSLFVYSNPKRGDIVVFTRPDEEDTIEDESSINIIKRVIGLPGDTVEVRGTSVLINNQLFPESYVTWAEGGLKEGNFGPKKVPEGRVLLLGDNRDQSKDSRFWEDPFLEIDRIKGRALIIYWSWDSPSRIGQIVR